MKPIRKLFTLGVALLLLAAAVPHTSFAAGTREILASERTAKSVNGDSVLLTADAAGAENLAVAARAMDRELPDWVKDINSGRATQGEYDAALNFDMNQSKISASARVEYEKAIDTAVNRVIGKVSINGKRPSNMGTAFNTDILRICSLFAGDKYSQDLRWGKGYSDCSSFVVRVYAAMGINLAIDGEDTTAALLAESLNDDAGSLKDLRVGDLIFWSSWKNGRYKNITHVAIFAGYQNGEAMMWECAPSSDGVIYRRVQYQGTPLSYARRPVTSIA